VLIAIVAGYACYRLVEAPARRLLVAGNSFSCPRGGIVSAPQA
jgi:hypothetical protein